jgi:AcrR family transcriptional regulator
MRFGGVTRTAAQTRVLDAALGLIVRHGVGGTFRMIADAMGVTKAAVYRQFKTKDAIVIALAERELGSLEAVLEAAEVETNPARARDLLLDKMIDVAIEHRGMTATLPFDPVVVRMLIAHRRFRGFIERLYAVLLGGSGHQERLTAAMLSDAISVGVMHPLVAGIDPDTLRADLLRTARRMLDFAG